MEESSKKTKRLIRNFIFFVLLIIITFYIVFKDQNVFDILDIINNVNKGYLAIAILCMCIFIMLDAVNIGRSLRSLKEQSTFLQNVKYSLIRFFL